MKRIILVLAIITITLALGAFGTIAYFTAQGTASNVITAGNVTMKLHDETAAGDAFPENGLSGIMPGDTVDKIVYIENTGDNAFYTRIKLKNSISPRDGLDSALSFEPIQLNIDTNNWQLGANGWYYYQSAVEAGVQTPPLFTEVRFESGMGNDYMDANIQIEVIAQAVQQANNGTTVWQAAGWPME